MEDIKIILTTIVFTLVFVLFWLSKLDKTLEIIKEMFENREGGEK